MCLNWIRILYPYLVVVETFLKKIHILVKRKPRECIALVWFKKLRDIFCISLNLRDMFGYVWFFFFLISLEYECWSNWLVFLNFNCATKEKEDKTEHLYLHEYKNNQTKYGTTCRSNSSTEYKNNQTKYGTTKLTNYP